MKRLIIGIFLVSLIALAVVPAQDPTKITLVPGKNKITIENYIYPIYVSTLVNDYPQIESVTLERYGKSYGYVSAFGGLGTNFIVEYGSTYEIVTSEELTISLR